MQKRETPAKELKNPCTKEYLDFKKFIHSDSIAWYYYSSETFEDQDPEDDIPFYSHKIMERPSKYKGTPYAQITSKLFEPVYSLLSQIFEHNKLDVSVIYRINLNVNFSLPTKNKRAPYHVDLTIPHQNLLIYMSEFKGGELYIRDDTQEIKLTPQEDDIILFGGDLQHCAASPVGKERRIVMVANLL